MRSSIRGLTEGAIIAAINIILVWLTVYTPFTLVSVLLMSVPFIIYAVRHEGRLALWACVAAIALSGILFGITGLLISMQSAIPGMVMGIVYRKQRNAWNTLAFGFLIFMLTSVLFMWAMSTVADVNVIDSIKHTMNESIKLTQKFNPDQQVQDMMKKMVELFVILIPAIIIMTAIVTVGINFGVANRIMKRLGMPVYLLPLFRDWKFPRILLFYYLIILIMGMFPAVADTPWLHAIVLNGNMVISIFLVVQGLSFIAYFAHAKGWNKSVPVIAGIGAFFTGGIGFFFFSLLGLLDMGFDLRGRVKSKR